METPETPITPAPLGKYCTRLLLLGPAGVPSPPRDTATRGEVRRVWGRHGEKVGVTWRLHETFLRAAAAERNLRPMFRGQFFGEAIAAQKGNQR